MEPHYFKKLYIYTPSEQAKKLPFCMLRAGWRAYKPGYKNKRENGEFFGYQIQYVIRGKGHILWNDRKFTIEQNQMFFLDLSRAHTYYADYEDPWEAIWILFDGQQSETFYQLSSPANPVHTIRNRIAIEQGLHRIIKFFTERPIGVDVLFSSTMTTILSELIVQRLNETSTTRKNNLAYTQEIDRAIKYIEQNYHLNISLNEVAAFVKFSPYYFSRLFKRVTGYTVGEYITKYRITQAKIMLAETSDSIAYIAERNGFSDQSHMGRVFRKYEHITPRQYRLKAKEHE